MSEITQQEHLDAIEILKQRCFELSFVIGGLPKTRKVTPAQAAAIATQVGGSQKSIKTSWRIFSDEHPAVRELNLALGDLQRYRNTFAFVTDRSGDGTSSEGGRRLIMAEDHARIYNELSVLARVVETAAAKVQAALPEIKAIDQRNAGTLWSADRYPENIAAIVGIPKDAQGRYIIELGPTAAVPPGLTPEVREMLVDRIYAKLSGSIEATVEQTVEQLSAGITTLLSEIATLTRLSPIHTHELYELAKNGEIEQVRIERHSDNPDVPVDHVRLYLQHRVRIGDSDELTTTSRWYGPYSTEEYEKQLRPIATPSTRRIYASVIDGLLEQMQDFQNKRQKLLGAHGTQVSDAYRGLFDALARYGGGDADKSTGEKVRDAVRRNEERRQQLEDAARSTIVKLRGSVEVTRRLTRNLRVMPDAAYLTKTTEGDNEQQHTAEAAA